jgi:hypothetical protein
VWIQKPRVASESCNVAKKVILPHAVNMRCFWQMLFHALDHFERAEVL